jgi:hypothetical protein
LGGAIIFLTLIFFCLAAGTLVNRSWGERITTWMNNQLMVRNRLPAVLALLVFGFFFSLAVIGLFQTSLTSLLGMLVVVYQRSFLLVLWLGLFCVQAGILLWSLYPSWRVRTFWDVPRSDTFVSTLLITGLLTGFLAHLAVVYFQLHI